MNVGRDAVLQAVAKGYDTAKIQQTHTTDEVTVFGGSAYALGTWKLNPKTGVDAPALHGKWSGLYKRNSNGLAAVALDLEPKRRTGGY